MASRRLPKTRVGASDLRVKTAQRTKLELGVGQVQYIFTKSSPKEEGRQARIHDMRASPSPTLAAQETKVPIIHSATVPEEEFQLLLDRREES